MNDSSSISQLLRRIQEGWCRGEQPPDAQAALRAHPYLRRWKSVVLELACEEFHLRTAEGESLAPDAFCRRFPDYQRSLLHRLEVEQYLRRHEDQEALPWPQPGDRFLGYRLLEQLGRGALGRVFLAQEIEMRDRLVVVKITPRGLREAQTLAVLNHPHIVPVYRYDEDPATGMAAICMPYLSRATLEDFLAAAQNGPWPPRDFAALLTELEQGARAHETGLPQEAAPRSPWRSYTEGVLDLGRQIAEALVHTHQRGVLHLDLKPSNVLLLPGGRPLLLDFNLSVEGAMGASVIGGTLPYMSPEQLQEAILGRTYSSRPVDGRSDLFSLGVMLYELLTGRHPFGEIPRCSDPREAAKALLRRHEQGPQALDASEAGLDREVMRLLDSCLAFHPDQRPGSAQETAATLERLLAPRFRFRRWRRAHRRTVATAGIAAAVLAAILAAAPLLPRAATHRPAVPSASLERTSGRLAKAELTQAPVENPLSAEAWEQLARTQCEQKNYREASESFLRAYKLSANARFFAEVGHAKFFEQQFDTAEVWYRRAVDSGYESAEVYYRLARCLSRKLLFADAKACYDRALELNPGSLEIRLSRLKNELTWAGRERRAVAAYAVEDARLAVRLAPEDPEVLLRAASSLALTSPNEEFVPEIHRYLVQACERGLDRQRLDAMPFRPFFDKSWFQQLRSGPKSP